MKTSDEKTAWYCCAICMMMALLSSCSTTDEQYAQWNGEPTLIDAGPNRKPAPKPDAMPAPKPDAMPAPKPEVVTADGAMESLVADSAEPVDVSYQADPVEKKRFRLFGRRDNKESMDMEAAPPVREASPAREVVTADGSMESLVATNSKPADVSYPAEPEEKKKFKLFGRKDKSQKEAGDMETASHVSYAGAANREIPVVEAPVEPVIHVAPKTAPAKKKTKPVAEKKSGGNFDSWLKAGRR